MQRNFTNRNNFSALRLPIASVLAGFATFGAVIFANGAEIKDVSAFSPALIEAIDRNDVVIIGEIHPNLEHHENQAALVKRISPSAIVFEMVAIGQGPAFAQAYRRNAGDLEARIEDGEFGWPTLGDYLGILQAAPDAAIFGAASPRADVRNTVSQGAAEVFGPEAARFGLATDLPPEQQAAREDLQRVAHCNALPEDLLSGMVEAQRFRDAVFARRVLEALEQTGGPVVMIAGNGHAREDWGVPAALRTADPGLSVLSVIQSEEARGDSSAQITLQTAPFDEGDPCAQFNKK